MPALSVLRKLDEIFDEMKPLASLFGVEKIANYADTVIELAKVTLERFEEGRDVWNSTDEAYVRGLIEKLQKENDELNDRIRNS